MTSRAAVRPARLARLAALALLCAGGAMMLSGCTTSMLGSAAASAAATAASNKLSANAQPPKAPDQKPDPKEAARLRVELAALYFSRGSIGPALDEANSAAKLDPENPHAFNLLGLINMQLKEDAQATQNFERALRIASADPDINNNYGWFLCERGRPAESIKFFLAAVRSPLYTNVDRSLVNAGVCSRRRGDDAEARRFFEQALGVRANQPVALFNLADISFAGGQVPEARAFLNRFMQAAAPTAEVLWLGVRVERALGDRRSEAIYAQQLRRLFPNAPEAQLLSQQGGR
ncbi:MAG: type IV pilus biogenesis/stability protein PilW [bacterium]|jgi:type IV pilus assembly protein PilF|nr:type IV pilus biogenesis/stability protein PilW [Betaproteobacteria bacterium]